MMKWIFTGMILLSLVFGICNGQGEALNAAAISSCEKAVTLALTLGGSICLWSGLMKVAQESGLTENLARLRSPFTRRLFRGVRPESPAMQAITLNLTANLLGLGNAATPLGVSAVRELAKEAPSYAKHTATDPMILFVVMNTASLQLIPTTTAVLRLKYGAADPLDILPAVWVVSLLSLAVGLTLALILNRIFPLESRKRDRR